MCFVQIEGIHPTYVHYVKFTLLYTPLPFCLKVVTVLSEFGYCLLQVLFIVQKKILNK